MIDMYCQNCGTKRHENLTAASQSCVKCGGTWFKNERPNKDSRVTCGTCRGEQYVNFQACLQGGWPKCCGYTMRLTTTEANIESAVVGVVGAQIPRLSE